MRGGPLRGAPRDWLLLPARAARLLPGQESLRRPAGAAWLSSKCRFQFLHPVTPLGGTRRPAARSREPKRRCRRQLFHSPRVECHADRPIPFEPQALGSGPAPAPLQRILLPVRRRGWALRPAFGPQSRQAQGLIPNSEPKFRKTRPFPGDSRAPRRREAGLSPAGRRPPVQAAGLAGAPLRSVGGPGLPSSSAVAPGANRPGLRRRSPPETLA